MRSRSRALGIFLTALATGCGILDPNGSVEVRVENASPLTFDEGVLYTDRDSILFEGLQSGESTPYHKVEKVYGLATAWVVTGTDTARLQVIDFMGMEPLDPGRYTFLLSFHEEGPRFLSEELRRDR